MKENPEIVRNQAKIRSAVDNARAVLAVQKDFGSFYKYLYSFLPENKPIINLVKRMSDLPTTTPISEIISKDLKRRGFRFVGPTIIYAFMQAVGMTVDHEQSCFRAAEWSHVGGSARDKSPKRSKR